RPDQTIGKREPRQRHGCNGYEIAQQVVDVHVGGEQVEHRQSEEQRACVDGTESGEAAGKPRSSRLPASSEHKNLGPDEVEYCRTRRCDCGTWEVVLVNVRNRPPKQALVEEDSRGSDRRVASQAEYSAPESGDIGTVCFTRLC